MMEKNPTLAYEQIKKLNDLLGFADDTLIYSQNIHDIRRAIEGVSIEIAEMGLDINPRKCTLVTKNMDMEETKDLTKTWVIHEHPETKVKGNVYWGANVHCEVKASVKKGSRIYRRKFGLIADSWGNCIRQKRVGDIFDDEGNLVVTNDIRI